VDEAWSLSDRPGYLRLKSSRVVPNLYLAPNTLTQRMEGPTCSGSIEIDLSHLKDGDCAGFAALNGNSGVLTVTKQGRKLTLSMSEQAVSLSNREKLVESVSEKVIESVALKQSKIWLRIDGDFMPRRDIATFYYSLDGEQWTKIGSDYKMQFDFRRFFMGSKFAIFYYATRKLGGYIDVNKFSVHNS
jgi:beta-xylosidase